MRFRVMIALGVCVLMAAREWSLQAQTSSSSPTHAVVVAADAFLDTLSAELRGKVQFPFSPQKNATMATFDFFPAAERRSWKALSEGLYRQAVTAAM